MSSMSTFEELRASYRPDRITTLFVGESAPYAGTFFYNETSGLFREVKKAFRGKEFFLEDFRRNGFYMDDLVREPVNQLDGKSRRLLCHQAVASLAKRLEDYKPNAIVILLHRIKPMVLDAMSEAEKHAAALVGVDKKSKRVGLALQNHPIHGNRNIVSRVHHRALKNTGDDVDCPFHSVRAGQIVFGVQRKIVRDRR